MKNLIGLDIKLNPPNDRENPANVPTFKEVIVDSLKYAPPKDGSDAIRLDRLANRIFDLSSENNSLEDADFFLMKDNVNKNHARYLSWALGQTMQKIQEWESGK